MGDGHDGNFVRFSKFSAAAMTPQVEDSEWSKAFSMDTVGVNQVLLLIRTSFTKDTIRNDGPAERSGRMVDVFVFFANCCCFCVACRKCRTERKS